jgi:dienelactone hydrolase
MRKSGPTPPQSTMLGGYGAWAAGLQPDPPRLSYRRAEAPALEQWREEARAKALELLAVPEGIRSSPPRVTGRTRHDGLEIEELEWSLPYGPPTQAVFMRPQGRKRRLPAVLALHDHGGMKYFGKQKIIQGARLPHPIMEEHQRLSYGGRGWASALAHRGYAVLVHDAFPFESRRIRLDEVPRSIAGGLVEPETPTMEDVIGYNRWAAEQETVVAKSLACAGTTWPGVCLLEDTVALDHLVARAEVDPDRVGCGGLSGGGMRTVFLGGLDPRVRAAFCAGFMTTWRDFILGKSFTHTWMAFPPLLPRYLEFPEILGLRVPRPTLVVSSTGDDLYTPTETRRAVRILEQVYRKAGAGREMHALTYPGPHQLDVRMQEDVFAWLDEKLKA